MILIAWRHANVQSAGRDDGQRGAHQSVYVTTPATLISPDIRLQDQEPDSGLVPAAQWPENGRIAIRDLEVRYSPELPAGLSGINLEINVGPELV